MRPDTHERLLRLIEQEALERARDEREYCAKLVEQAKVAVSGETDPARVCDILAKMLRGKP